MKYMDIRKADAERTIALGAARGARLVAVRIPKSIRKRVHPILSGISIVSLALATFAGIFPAAQATAPQNPPLTQSCGLDIALVIDSSGSISPGPAIPNPMGQMKDAFHAFVGAFLDETPTQFSVTDFDTTANVTQGFTDNATLVDAAIDAAHSGGQTNWEDALVKAQSTFDPRPSHPNLVVFASDGNPNFMGSGAGAASTTEANALASAVSVADSLKSSGTRILTLGIGSALNVDNLKAISGPSVDTGATSDVITTNFGELAGDLAEIARQLCGGTITVTKKIDLDGNLATTNDQSDGGLGWTFDVGGQVESTDEFGQTPAVELTNGTYDVTETAGISGYSLVGASCDGAAANGSPTANGVSGVQITTDNIVACTFYNTPDAGTLIVKKMVLNDSGGQASAGDFTISVSGGLPDSFPGSESGTVVSVAAGIEYLVTEGAGPDGYSVSYSDDCQGTMTPGGTSTCTVTNDDIAPQVTTGTLTVIKDVKNDNGGDAEASDFPLKVTNSADGETSVSNGVPVDLAPGEYTIGEEGGPNGYTGTIGTGEEDDCNSEGALTIVAGQSYTCTITNDDQPGTLIVKKTVVNDDGGTADAGDFSFVVNDGDPIPFELADENPLTGESHMTVNAGSYDVSELAASGYATTHENCSEIVIPNGGSATCTIINNDIAVEPTPQCSDGSDNDADEKIDSADPGCHSDGNAENSQSYDANDNDESTDTVNPPPPPPPSPTPPPPPPPPAEEPDVCPNIAGNQSSVPSGLSINSGGDCIGNSGGGGGGGGGFFGNPNDLFGGTPAGGSGGGAGGGQVAGSSIGQSTPPPGQVLGESCGIYLTDYIKFGANNNPDQVNKLQTFLNEQLGLNLPLTGIYGTLTRDAVNQFQMKFWEEVLLPWVPHGLPTAHTPTGYVYKTTKRWINMIKCAELNLPIPLLP